GIPAQRVSAEARHAGRCGAAAGDESVPFQSTEVFHLGRSKGVASIMNYPDSVHFLYALGNEIKTAKLGLDRTRAVLEALGRPQDRVRFVHVAGTNGKGSTC